MPGKSVKQKQTRDDSSNSSAQRTSGTNVCGARDADAPYSASSTDYTPAQKWYSPSEGRYGASGEPNPAETAGAYCVASDSSPLEGQAEEWTTSGWSQSSDISEGEFWSVSGDIHASTTPIDEPGVVSHAGGVNLRDAPLPGSQSEEVEWLPFNTPLFVVEELAGGWYRVTTREGGFGYVAKTHVRTGLPGPDARLHRVEEGESAIGIAQQYYGDRVKWGRDLRYYVNVLVEVNRGEGRRGIYRSSDDEDWEETRVRSGYLIWIPGAEYAEAYRREVSSGSRTYEAAQTARRVAENAVGIGVGAGAFIAGFFHGIISWVWDLLVGLKELASLLIKSLMSLFRGELLDDVRGLWEELKELDIDELVQGWIDHFQDRWNAEGIWDRWKFRGWVVGYAFTELVVLFATYGILTGVKWLSRAGELAKALARLTRADKVLEKARDYLPSTLFSDLTSPKLRWTSWTAYPKVEYRGRLYAQIGDRLYTRHAVDRMQPGGLGAPAGERKPGRSISPTYVEEVITTGSARQITKDGVVRTIHESGTVRVITEEAGKIVVTVIPRGVK